MGVIYMKVYDILDEEFANLIKELEESLKKVTSIKK